jgi:hypothetical protein
MALTAVIALLSTNFATAHEEDDTSIKVHGDWEITVTNPDGSIAQERSFQNALVTPGLLVGLLYQASEWTNSFAGTLWVNGDGILPWYIEVETSGVETATCQTYLTVSFRQFGNEYERTFATASAVSSSSFTLTRTLSLPLECVTGESYAINGVSTAFIAFGVDSGGGGLGDSRFTEKTLAAPITGIQPDQIVTLKATISFQ